MMSIVVGLVVAAVIFLVPFTVYKLTKANRKEMAEAQLCRFLFPEGDEQKDEVVDKLMSMTSNKYSRDDMLDYYIKIKGLQLVDLMAYSNDRVSKYLMQPTRIHLDYSEVVLFYEEFLNYSQPKGVNASGAMYSSGERSEA